MEEIILMKTRANMHLLFWKIQYSLEEIKQKRPDRTDYIESMTRSLEWLGDAMQVYRFLEEDYRLTKSRCFDLERINLELNTDNVRLKKLVEDLTNRIEL